MPYYIRDPKRDPNFDNHTHVDCSIPTLSTVVYPERPPVDPNPAPLTPYPKGPKDPIIRYSGLG